MTSPAILASSSAGGPTPYHADAVQTDGSVNLSIASLTATDNGFISWTGWIKTSSAVYQAVWQVDPANTFTSGAITNEYISTIAKSAGGSTISIQSLIDIDDDIWHSVITTISTNHPDGSKIGKIYIDRVDVTQAFNDGFPAFTLSFNGLPFFLLDDTFGEPYIGALADWRIMPGMSLLTGSDIASSTLDLFATADNKPVDPAVATGALGAPCMLFSGPAASFGTNQGTGGPTVQTGVFTDAPSPSD